MSIKKNIRRILSEDMNWIDDVEAAMPTNSDILETTMSVKVSLGDFLSRKHHYDFITGFLENGKLIEFIMSDTWDVDFSTYDNIEKLADHQDITINNKTIEGYVSEFNMVKVDTETDNFIRKAIPLPFIGIYIGNL